MIKEFDKFPALSDLPNWGFDGSSTKQAEGRSSDCVLKPVAVYPDSTRINGVRKWLRRTCRRHWGLTGTPAPNSLLELFAQVRLLDGGKHLGPEFSAHRDAFFEPTDWNEYNWVPQAGARERIYAQLGDLAIVLRNSEWLHIPDVFQEDV